MTKDKIDKQVEGLLEELDEAKKAQADALQDVIDLLEELRAEYERLGKEFKL